jgi:hypothetical protein
VSFSLPINLDKEKLKQSWPKRPQAKETLALVELWSPIGLRLGPQMKDSRFRSNAGEESLLVSYVWPHIDLV